MMETQDYRTKKDQRVRLKSDGQDALYASACAGSEGWAKKHKKDSLGYPMIYVEWDEDHWTYNGEPDRWVLEAHFDPVEEDMTEQEDQFRAFQEFQKWQAAQNEGESDPQKEDNGDDYEESVKAAEEVARHADAFILIAVSRDGDQDTPRYTPIAITGTKSEDSELVVELQLARLATVSHESLTARALQTLREGA